MGVVVFCNLLSEVKPHLCVALLYLFTRSRSLGLVNTQETRLHEDTGPRRWWILGDQHRGCQPQSQKTGEEVSVCGIVLNLWSKRGGGRIGEPRFQTAAVLRMFQLGKVTHQRSPLVTGESCLQIPATLIHQLRTACGKCDFRVNEVLDSEHNSWVDQSTRHPAADMSGTFSYLLQGTKIVPFSEGGRINE